MSASSAVARLPFVWRLKRLKRLRRFHVAWGLVLASVGCGAGAETRPAKWSYISPAIIQPSCATANCHSQLAQRSGVVLDSTYDGYDQLVNRHFVIPGKPDSSALIGLLRGQGSRRMPPDFPLPDVDIKLIEDWIMAGAMWDSSGPQPAPSVTP